MFGVIYNAHKELVSASIVDITAFLWGFSPQQPLGLRTYGPYPPPPPPQSSLSNGALSIIQVERKKSRPD